MMKARETPRRAAPRLWAEFIALFVAAPLFMALALPPTMLFPALFAVTFAGLVLLHLTPAFRWSDLLSGVSRVDWRFLAVFLAATAATGGIVVYATAPEAAFFLLRENITLMLAIALLYPVLSALPQEIVFRPLFFRRYDALLPRRIGSRIVLNAAIFSFAHLMYWSWIVAAMTFSGGLVFAYSYAKRGNFPEAVISHSFAGIIVFALGLGVFFYSGNVERPF